MAENNLLKMEADEKSVPLMVYTVNWLCWGEFIAKELIRVSTILRTNAAPEILCLHNARTIFPAVNANPSPISMPTMHIPVDQILAYHLIPPALDPLDFDPSEPNRRMDPVSVLAGKFQMDGKMRFASISNLTKYLDRTREVYTSIYDVEITCPIMPSLGVVKVPFALVRQATSIFSERLL